MTADKIQVQTGIAVASFSAGVVIASVCLFAVEPLGEISNTAISVVSELLVLCGALLGVKSAFDHKLNRFEAEIENKLNNKKEIE